MREITSHRVNPANDKIQILVTDEPGAGGANHRYELSGYDLGRNPSAVPLAGCVPSIGPGQVILFQNGPINEAGVNGVTQEVLIAICIDRLKSFQAGPFACRENAIALTKLEEAQMWLQKRTRDRMEKGIEGTHLLEPSDSIISKLTDILCKKLKVTSSQVTPDARFVEDLGADYLDKSELLMAIEEEFDVVLQDEDIKDARTVADVVKLLE